MIFFRNKATFKPKTGTDAQNAGLASWVYTGQRPHEYVALLNMICAAEKRRDAALKQHNQEKDLVEYLLVALTKAKALTHPNPQLR